MKGNKPEQGKTLSNRQKRKLKQAEQAEQKQQQELEKQNETLLSSPDISANAAEKPEPTANDNDNDNTIIETSTPPQKFENEIKNIITEINNNTKELSLLKQSLTDKQDELEKVQEQLKTALEEIENAKKVLEVLEKSQKEITAQITSEVTKNVNDSLTAYDTKQNVWLNGFEEKLKQVFDGVQQTTIKYQNTVALEQNVEKIQQMLQEILNKVKQHEIDISESDSEKEKNSDSDSEKEKNSDSDSEKEKNSDSDSEKEKNSDSDSEKEKNSDSDSEKEKNSGSESDSEKEPENIQVVIQPVLPVPRSSKLKVFGFSMVVVGLAAGGNAMLENDPELKKQVNDLFWRAMHSIQYYSIEAASFIAPTDQGAYVWAAHASTYLHTAVTICMVVAVENVVYLAAADAALRLTYNLYSKFAERAEARSSFPIMQETKVQKAPIDAEVLIEVVKEVGQEAKNLVEEAQQIPTNKEELKRVAIANRSTFGVILAAMGNTISGTGGDVLGVGAFAISYGAMFAGLNNNSVNPNYSELNPAIATLSAIGAGFVAKQAANKIHDVIAR